MVKTCFPVAERDIRILACNTGLFPDLSLNYNNYDRIFLDISNLGSVRFLIHATVGTTHMNFIFTRIVATVVRKADRGVNLYHATKFPL